MLAGTIYPYSSYPVTTDKVFHYIHSVGNREGLGVMASLDGDAIWRLGFRLPPVVPEVFIGSSIQSYPSLRLSALATVAGASQAHIEAKWASVAVEDDRESLSFDPNKWGKSSSGTDEYYRSAATDEPVVVYMDFIPRVRGTLGSLGYGEWAWGNQDSLGYDTVYVRLPFGQSPDADPDSQATIQPDYVQITREAETLNPSLTSEGEFTMNWTGSGDADKFITAYIPLNALLAQSTEEIAMDLTFLTSDWSVSVVSVWLAEIIWET